MVLRREHLPVLLFLLVAAAIFSALGGSAWLVLLDDGLFVVAVLAAALGWGAWPAKWLGFASQGSGRCGCVAVALGLGILSALTLVLGMLGGLSYFVAWGIVVVGWLLGAVYAWARGRLARVEPYHAIEQIGGQCPPYVPCVALLVVAFPLALMLFGATLPPGVLWGGENRAYDVLEYHLQAPREYFELGRIEFLPHNVYASFPQQMEMLYLLLMHLAGKALAGAIPAQLLHAACGILAVMALAMWSPRGAPRWVVVATAGTLPWLAYLGCLAYVELGMLFFAAVAGGIVLDCVRGPPSEAAQTDRLCSRDRGWFGRYAAAPTAGICAGLAAGCKYTSVVLVVVALAVAWVLTMPAGVRVRVRRLVLFGVGALIAMSPWLVRNAVFTGNPVYPFGYRWLGGAAWSAEQDAQWVRGHRLPPEQGTLVGRAQIAWDELLADRMFGPPVFLLALAGLLFARERATVTAAVWLGLIVVGWAAWTHMPGRFVLPAVVPLAWLGGSAIDAFQRRPRGADATRPWLQWALVGVATLGGLWQSESHWWSKQGVPLGVLPGATEEIAREQLLNRALPADAYAWLVGESRAFYLLPRMHYAVVFDRDPWLTYAETATPADAVAWLRRQNVTHVVFCWPEIRRLRDTYGFSPLVTRSWAQELAGAGLRRLETPELMAAETDVYEVGK